MHFMRQQQKATDSFAVWENFDEDDDDAADDGGGWKWSAE